MALVFARSLLFAILFCAITIVCVLVAFVALLIGPRAIRANVLAWTRIYRAMAHVVLGIRVRVEGPLPAGPALVVAKHEAMFETLVLVDILDGPIAVIKRELADIPLFGRGAKRYGMIPVDRDGSAAALKRLIVAARDAEARGRTILLFPEGTRVPHGETPPLRAGFTALYRATRLPVVPVAVDSGRLWPRGLMKYPGVITIRFGDPIPPGLPRAEAERMAHAAINLLNL